ncbi:Lrp/AsnC family transcriptional regulator [Yinghuangia sp. YIM S09857]|uniref:Lrp/AsnC family transcriptional regulator n=1 Tax=Yinghuangia sp. YIM S09857 TaxID=3436929 RepID=UPI003F52FCEA
MHDLKAAPGPDALDELDLQLVHALQLVPRAAWTDLAPILGASPATLARRWRRMESAGAAWTTCHPGLRYGAQLPVDVAAFVEVSVVPGRVVEVAARLARHRQTVAIEHLTGDRDLLVSVIAVDAGRLADYLQTHLPSVPGITRIRVQMPLRMYQESGAWRLRTLDRDQRRRLAELPRPRPDHAAQPLDADDVAVLTCLGPDGRLSTAELARRLNLSGVTAARRLARLVGSGYARFRCEVARSLTGWPVTATWWLRIPSGELDSVAAELITIGDVRMCASITGPANLMLVMWLRHSADVGSLQAEWSRRFPRMDVLDSALTLQAMKSMGRLLDADGYSTGFVPLFPGPAAPTATTTPPARELS